MKFEGQSIQCSMLEGGRVELRFDLKDDSVNKFNKATLSELAEAIGLIKADPEVRGLLVTSGKDCFIVGADVTEFTEYFKNPEDQLAEWLLQVDKIFSTVEDFPFPSVTAINGFAFGGGLEFCLATSYRVMASDTRIGVPETKLGIFPGWGGTVRLSRLTGADNAIEWIAGGDQHGAEEALRIGAVDAVVPPAKVREAALDLLAQAMAGRRDWKARRLEKVSPLKLNPTETMMVFEGAKAFVAAKAGPNYPSPVAAIEAMQRGATRGRDDALAIEAAAFARMAKTPTAYNLVTIFLGDHYVGKVAKKLAKAGAKVESAAVLGAGIMGGGIAYQSASRGTRIVMKDIAEKALDLGLAEADKLLVKRVERGKLTAAAMADVLTRIRPTLSYGDFKAVDLAVEAVVENEQVKKAVLAEVEGQVREDAILASNTSTISITRLAEGLKRPQNFCGMHFFNPVHKMPLVEVIRGRASSERAVATTVGYALAMGKTPIVVNDCPGFLVNRVLFPYFAGFIMLVNEGVDFQRIDKVMEKFGWPMGPAYLLDVVGIDTAHHADGVMAREFPDRMAHEGRTAIEAMFELKRFGQKNGKGFYAYVPDRKGAPKKEADPEVPAILQPLARADAAPVTDQDIIDRMMLPMIIECSRCLEDRIVATPVEVDIGLVYGLGFPPFRGGALRYADAVGLRALCEKAEKLKRLGRLYEPTAQMQKLAEAGLGFHQEK
ncbi:fatty acid oxidation complex subunit alpha FadB [Geothrix sp. 21YS21S-2]|uniref:fatty acid oxidation complex subunit alpha FadB n=1 Tax=Geothrix sp. 21YS21S-2 TaxID=3068893 RepID=UPI00358E361E